MFLQKTFFFFIFCLAQRAMLTNASPTSPTATLKLPTKTIWNRGEALVNPRESVTLGNTTFKLKDLPAPYQGSRSEIYDTIFNGKPAIMKIVEKKETEVGRMHQEIRNVRKFGLWRGDWEDETHYYLLLRNVRNGWPKEGGEPLKPFHEWYLADKALKAQEGLERLKTATKAFLVKSAEKGGVAYHNVHLRSVFVDEKLETAMGADFTANLGGKFAGVEELYDKQSIEAFVAKVDKLLDEQFSVEKLQEELKLHDNAELRDTDKKDIVSEKSRL